MGMGDLLWCGRGGGLRMGGCCCTLLAVFESKVSNISAD